MLDIACPNCSFAHHAGSFKLSVAIVVIVSGYVQYVIMESQL
jgi:hypothetical protein